MSRCSAFRCAPLLLWFVTMLALAAAPVIAQTCSEGSPAFGADNRLWGGLRPGDVDAALANPVQLPDERDSTNYDGHGLPGLTLPLYSGVDIENDWVFTSSVTGFQIWDASGANAEKPVKAGGADLRTGGCTPNTGFWVESTIPVCTEVRHFIWDISAPPGKDDIIALSGMQPVGFAIVDTSNKTSPRLLYQDNNTGAVAPDGSQVHTDVIGGRDYAFFASQDGLHVYDMTAARGLSKCLRSSGLCPNVYKTRIGGAVATIFVAGLATSAGGHFVASSSLAFEFGLRIWDVGNPAAPVSVGRFLTNEVISGLAMWEQAGSQYLALHTSGQGRIYDVTSCLAGGCASLPSPIWTGNWSDYGQAPLGATRLFVDFSRSGSTPFLFFGSNDQCSGGRQREFLFDVSNPASPGEITPDGTIISAGKTIDYWGWYYAGNRPGAGYSRVMAMAAEFNGAVLYRAAYTVFDTHVWTQAAPTPPTANFEWSPQSPIYPGTSVTFTDTSKGAVTSRTWTFPADATVSSTTDSPVTASFSSPGVKPVRIDVSNQAGPGSVTKDVTVLDPSPAIGSVVAAPAGPLTCDAVTWTAQDVTGNPAPTVGWVVKRDATAETVASGTGSSVTFTPPGGGTTPGNYTATATATAGALSASKSLTVNMTSPPALGFTGPPTNDAFSFGTVTFHANSQGASAWSWDFGDGQSFRGFTGPYNTPDPVFTYSSTGQKTVRVIIKNCAGELQSSDLTITVLQVQPVVIEKFLAQGCLFGFCSFGVNQLITFDVQVSGGPTSYEVNWNGDGTTWTTVTPQNNTITHSYGQAGSYSPILRVQRNSEPPVTATHTSIIIDSTAPPPPPPPPPPRQQITISGPSTGQANQTLSFSAAASGCTPVATWSWSASGGGAVSGSGNSVDITWPSDGSKTVSVTNSGCSGVTGTKSVQIGAGGGGGGGGLAANFTFTPANPNAGQQVTFDGGSSTGSPTGYTWTLPGGVIKTGQSITHTFTSAGSFPVSLEVSKQGTGTGCSLGVCTATTTKQVTVGGGGPPPFAADFTTTAQCVAEFGINQCTAETGQSVQFTANAPGATTWSWTFGDGGTASGADVSHTWTQPGSFQVTLTAGNGTATAIASRQLVITGQAIQNKKSVVLPWIAQTRGALLQSSDLYVHNPGTTAMNVTLEFRKKGAPEENPPRVSKTIAPGATFYVADVLKELFNKENIAGFISLTVDDGVAPVITSFNTTFNNDGKEFGQTVAGVPMVSGTSAVEDKMQHLVGLINNDERLAYFGVSNPSDQPTVYKLRFFDKTGLQIGADSQDFLISKFGQKQFQSKEIHDDFGISNVADFRVELETKSGGHLVPYASNLRLSSEDPSFILAGLARAAKVYLIGVLSTPGLNDSLWQTDALLSNPTAEPITADITFTSVGLNGTTTSPLRLTLNPGQTERLENVIDGQWGIENAIGALTITTISGGAFPIVQGESYDNTDPEKRFGQTMMAVSDANAAGAGQGQHLVGLRQDADNRTTFWLFNPSNETAEYDLVYRRLDGTPLGSPANVRLGAGKLRQFSPGQHPLPADGVADGFTVQILVKSGKVLGAAQVINNLTNDPAYIQGEVR